MSTDIAQGLAEFTARTRYEDIPAGTIEFTKGLYLKTVAGMIRGATMPAGLKAIQSTRTRAHAPDAGVMGDSSKWSRIRLMTGCTPMPTHTMLVAMVFFEKSAPVRRASSADWRYRGKPSSNFDVVIHARALSLNKPLGMICAGLGARRRAP